ncbi:hypothetical protein EYR41_002143 [Orbilia oligospora]|uniref:Uncharacterized protein n=1 Tax=Orbilia oligospora TaxID=2813651 RepID=A0A7C8PJP3_ORBOL|nr:hypothetical protein TWF751_004670 [Orbilia oligospora]TGJ75204.1 hypothetical protein EYR41_002143 [Orbilia oligospora]
MAGEREVEMLQYTMSCCVLLATFNCLLQCTENIVHGEEGAPALLLPPYCGPSSFVIPQ